MTIERPRRLPRPTGDPELDERLAAFVDALDPIDQRIALEAVSTLIQLARDDDVSRLDRKIANTALKEMRHAFKVFAPYRDTHKVTIFGSARTHKDEADYATARDFAKEMAARGWMVITGAGPGIMEAGHEGAAAEFSIGVGILLPFEAAPNPVIADDPKLMNFKYFFTRKLMFIKESDAFVLLPGGFGTMDEAFELLTLTQTGKSDLHPIVLLDAPGGTYWRSFERFIRDELLTRRFIDESDFGLYLVTDDINEAVAEIERFYRVYHSERYVGSKLVLRLNRAPSDELLAQLSEEFSDVVDGPIERVEASPAEIRDNDVPHLPRIALGFDRAHTGKLRRLIDRLNDMP
ncbi:MAG TPA: TIGR00730 family Rossman fold protein [Actinomycetota bacterium]|nr:TIGR00730 family Rossman fold protein [Actinomycetota bacterium]